MGRIKRDHRKDKLKKGKHVRNMPVEVQHSDSDMSVENVSKSSSDDNILRLYDAPRKPASPKPGNEADRRDKMHRVHQQRKQRYLERKRREHTKGTLIRFAGYRYFSNVQLDLPKSDGSSPVSPRRHRRKQSTTSNADERTSPRSPRTELARRHDDRERSRRHRRNKSRESVKCM